MEALLVVAALGLAASAGWARQTFRRIRAEDRSDRLASRFLDLRDKHGTLERLHDAAAKEVRRLSRDVSDLTGEVLHQKKLSAARMTSTIDAFQRSARFKKRAELAEAEAASLRIDLADAKRPRTATREELDRAVSRWANHTAKPERDSVWVEE